MFASSPCFLTLLLLLPGSSLSAATAPEDGGVGETSVAPSDGVVTAASEAAIALEATRTHRLARAGGCSEQKILASDAVGGAGFGISVSISGNLALVGGIFGDLGGDAYVYRYDGEAWVEEAKLVASDAAAGDLFGVSVAVSGDVAVIGAVGDADAGPAAGSAYVFRYDGVDWTEEAKLVADDAATGDSFGISVSASGDVALVGAGREDEGGAEAGAAYVFRYGGESWVQEAKLVASDAGTDDRFGQHLSVSGDVAIIGAPRDDEGGSDSGAAYLFRYDGLEWLQEAKLVAGEAAAEDRFGNVVSVSGDVAVVGSSGDDDSGDDSGSAHVFRYDGEEWVDEAELHASDAGMGDRFGSIVSVSGDEVLVGAFLDDDGAVDAGSAYLFRYDGEGWIEQEKLVAGDPEVDHEFGRAVSVAGDVALIGAHRDSERGREAGAAYFFRCRPVSCVEREAELAAGDAAAGDAFGISVSVSGDVAISGARHDDDAGTSSGSAHVFRYDGADWTDETKLVAGDAAGGDLFGSSVSVSGDVALVGAMGDDDGGDEAGSAYVFRYDGDAWVQESKLAAAEPAAADEFGISVSVSGDVAVIGADRDDDAGSDSGSASVFRRDGSDWLLEAKLVAADAAADDRFGWSVSVSGDVALVGAPGDDDGGTASGSALVFRYDGAAWVQEAKLVASDPEAGDSFGGSVSIAGDLALIGADRADARGIDSGVAHVFRYDGEVWVAEAVLLAGDSAPGDQFGRSVSVAGDLVLVGAPLSEEPGSDSGSAHVFHYDGADWIEEAKLLAGSPAADDRFGGAVSLSGSVALVGAIGDAEARADSGLASLFRLEPCPTNEPPACDAGPDVNATCDGIQLQGSATDPDGDPLTYSWSSSCPDVVFSPGPDLPDPIASFGTSCDVTCSLTLTVEDGQGGVCRSTLEVDINDDSPPELAPPVPLVVECPQPEDGPETEAAWLESVSATDNCGTPGTFFAELERVESCSNTYRVTYEFWAVDDCGNESAHLTSSYEVVDTIRPQIFPPMDVAVECPVPETGPGSEREWLASASASDACGGARVRTELFERIPGCGNTYTHVWSFWAVDECGNEAEREERSYEVVDTTPPTFDGEEPIFEIPLWPPGHGYTVFTTEEMVSASDTCGNVVVTVTGCESNQPEEVHAGGLRNGDGRTFEDCVLAVGGDQFATRAERLGGCGRESSRLYSLEFTATDECGNSATVTGLIRVDHDRRGNQPRRRGRRLGPSAPPPFDHVHETAYGEGCGD